MLHRHLYVPRGSLQWPESDDNPESGREVACVGGGVSLPLCPITEHPLLYRPTWTVGTISGHTVVGTEVNFSGTSGLDQNAPSCSWESVEVSWPTGALSCSPSSVLLRALDSVSLKMATPPGFQVHKGRDQCSLSWLAFLAGQQMSRLPNLGLVHGWHCLHT